MVDESEQFPLSLFCGIALFFVAQLSSCCVGAGFESLAFNPGWLRQRGWGYGIGLRSDRWHGLSDPRRGVSLGCCYFLVGGFPHPRAVVGRL